MLLISASQKARITGISHCCQAYKELLRVFFGGIGNKGE
jgi:hypothetical protein